MIEKEKDIIFKEELEKLANRKHSFGKDAFCYYCDQMKKETDFNNSNEICDECLI